MAKKDGFNFDTGSKFNMKGGSGVSLTKKQKEIIFITLIALVIVVAIVMAAILIAKTGNSGSYDDITGSGSQEGGSEGGSEEGNEGGDSSNGDGVNIPDVISKFYISTLPEKLTYYVGQSADYSGLVVYIDSEESGSIFVGYDDSPDALLITGFDSFSPVEKQTITVACRGFTDTFTITIKERESNPPKPVSIHFATYPKQEYHVDDKFSFKDGVLVCTYSDGSTKEIPLEYGYISGISKIKDPTKEHILLPGKHTLTIKYDKEGGVLVQTEYEITVTE